MQEVSCFTGNFGLPALIRSATSLQHRHFSETQTILSSRQAAYTTLVHTHVHLCEVQYLDLGLAGP